MKTALAVAAPEMAETEMPTNPMMEITGDMASRIAEGRKVGDEVPVTCTYRISDMGDGMVTLEAVDMDVQGEVAPEMPEITADEAIEAYRAGKA